MPRQKSLITVIRDLVRQVEDGVAGYPEEKYVER